MINIILNLFKKAGIIKERRLVKVKSNNFVLPKNFKNLSPEELKNIRG